MDSIRLIEDAIARHKKAVISCSGGKDSLAVMSLASPWADVITVVFVDMGDTFPHVRPFVEKACRMFGYPLHVVDSHPPEGVLPTDILPAWSTPFGHWLRPDDRKPEQQLISGLDCCNLTLWQPLAQAIRYLDTPLVIRGSKSTDAHVGIDSGTVFEGIEYLNPLDGWEDKDVYWYLQESGLELPEQYGLGVNHSLDCKHCTAWLDTPAEVQRIEYTRLHHPEVFVELQRRMALVLDEIDRRTQELHPALESIFQ